MSMGELLLIFVVTLLAFHPKKWPMLAHHIAKGLRMVQRYKHKAHTFWEAQLSLYQLEENEKKAAYADEQYKNSNPPS